MHLLSRRVSTPGGRGRLTFQTIEETRYETSNHDRPGQNPDSGHRGPHAGTGRSAAAHPAHRRVRLGRACLPRQAPLHQVSGGAGARVLSHARGDRAGRGRAGAGDKSDLHAADRVRRMRAVPARRLPHLRQTQS